MAQSVQKTLLKAQTLVRKGDPTAAAELYKSVLAKYPKNRKAQDGLRALQTQNSMTQNAAGYGTAPSPTLTSAQDRQFAELVAFFNHGQTARAVALARELMARPGGHAEAANILGAIYTAQEDHDAAITAYVEALRVNPDYADAHYNLAKAQAETEKLDAAVDSYTRATKLKPGFAQAHYNLANLLNRMGHPSRAAAQYEETLKLMPGYAEAHYNLGKMQAEIGQNEAAAQSFTQATRLEPDHLKAHLSLGQTFNKLYRAKEALPCFKRVLQIDPEHTGAMNALGFTLNILGQHEEAEQILQKALNLKPDFFDAMLNVGYAYSELGRDNEAITAYDRAINIKPDRADAYFNLCELYEKRNRRNDFHATLARAQEHSSSDHPMLLYLSAQGAVLDKNDAKAEGLLDQVDPAKVPPTYRTGLHNLMAKVCDRLGKYDKAFESFRASNETFALMPTAHQSDPDIYFRGVETLHEGWTSSTPSHWTAPPMPEDAPRLAFLLGFPRSGTTLLDTILRSHPEVGVVEEQPTVDRMGQLIGRLATPEVLDQLTNQQIVQLRQAYAAELRIHLGDGPVPPVVVDKMPLNTVHAGLIQRVFPDARFILALRHPCDSALSCYMQNFAANDALLNFTDIERTARLYDLVMSTWEGTRARLPLKVQSIYYEELVQDLRGAVEPVLHLLDLEWDDNLVNFQETAKARKRIHTASYNQVTEKLYTRASGRWTHYEKHMAPALPLLMPWAEHFGYT